MDVDHADWSNADIIQTYRDAWHVEDTFRDMKRPSWLNWRPQYHWTDDKIRVHAFICVMAVALVHLLRREVVHGGWAVSLPQLLEDLTGVQEVLEEHPIWVPGPLGAYRPHSAATATPRLPQDSRTRSQTSYIIRFTPRNPLRRKGFHCRQPRN